MANPYSLSLQSIPETNVYSSMLPLRLTLILGFIALLNGGLLGQNCGSRDTVLLQAEGESDYSLIINDFLNNDLADPMQGLCGVEISFAHQYVYDLEVTLYSPAGDSVILIGPDNSQTRPTTIFARWFIDFTTCAAPTAPDPGAPAIWNNNHPFNWLVGGVYTGTYHPNMGCLEDFDTGPVNGNWRLRFVSNRPNAQGAVIFFQLIFCDDRGVDCCFADAGEITEASLVRCEAHPDLDLEPNPFYAVPRPDSAEYAYSYLIAQDGVYIGLDSLADLTDEPPGNYEVCGFSYRRSELDSLPPPDGQLTVADLRDNLATFDPFLCADISENCIAVTILPRLDTTFLDRTICSGDQVVVGTNTYTTTGVYTNDLLGRGLCDSVVVLDLEVVDELRNFIDTSICFGQQFFIGSQGYGTTGLYIDTLVSAVGCDSIIELDLFVRDEIRTNLNLAICAGDTVFLGLEPFFNTTVTSRVLTSVLTGCDSTVNLDLLVLDPTIVLPPAPVINCFNELVTLDASSSTTANPPTYAWRDTLGQLLSSTPILMLDTAGTFIFELSESARGVNCLVRDTVIIEDLRATPAVDPGMRDTLTCSQQAVLLGGNGTVVGPTYTYAWTGPPGSVFLEPTDQPLTRVSTPGTYQLLVVNTETGCRDSVMAVVERDTLSPDATIFSDGDTLTCSITSLRLWADSLQMNNQELDYRWTSICLPAAVNGPSLNVDCPGIYRLFIRNTRTGCIDARTIQIEQDVALPMPVIATPDLLTCFNPSQVLDAGASIPEDRITYTWTDDQGALLGDADTLVVTMPQDYHLTLVDTVNGCIDSTAVTVLADQAVPTADAGPDTTALNCYFPTLTLGGTNSSQGPEFTYSWTIFGAPLDTLSRTESLFVEPPGGLYIFTVFNTQNGCQSSDSSRVLLQIDTPFVRINPPIEFGCFADAVTLDASTTFLGFDAQLTWSGPCLPPDTDTSIIEVACPGTYNLTVFNQDNGCIGDRTVTVELEDNALVAILPDSAFIDCVTGLATIDRSNSTPAFRTTWLRDGVEVFLPGQNPIVNVPGTYTMIISNVDSSCVDTASIEVLADCPILSIIVPPDSLTCDNTQVLLDAGPSIPTDPSEVTIEWLIPNPICAVAGANDRQIVVACPGTYGFVVNNILEGTSDTSYVNVIQDLVEPIAEAGPNDTLNCYDPIVTLNGSLSEQDPRFEYIWTNAGDDTLGFGQQVDVNEPGIYFLRVVNSETGCDATDVVTIFRNVAVPTLSFTDAFIPCMEDSFALTVIPDPMTGEYAFDWSGPLIQANGDSAVVLIGAEGNYTATVTNLENGCPTSATTFAEQLPCPPCLVLNDTALTCQSDTLLLDVDFCEPCQGCTFSWFRDGMEIVGATDTILPVTVAGSYRLRAVNIFGLVSNTSIIVSDLRVLPIAAAGPDRFLTCDSSSVLLGSEVIDTIYGFTYQWLESNGAPISGETTTFLRVDTPGNYLLEVYNPLSDCRGIDTVVVVYDTLAPTVIAGDTVTLTCEDPLGVINALGTSTGSAFEYQWSGGPAATCLEGVSTLNPIVACGGIYSLRVRNRLNGCESQDSVTVISADDLPAIIPLADTNLTCAIDTIVLEPFIDDPSYLTYWCEVDLFGDTLAGSCQRLANLPVGTVGDYRFTIVNQGTGCANQFTVTVGDDYRLPSVEAGMSDTLYCTLDSLALNGLGSTQSGASPLFRWFSETGFPVGSADQDTAYAFQPDRYFLEVTDPGNGCIAIDSVELFRDIAAPIATAGLDSVLNCSRRTLRLLGTGQTLSGQTQYSWSTPNGVILADTFSRSPLIGAAGTYFFSVTDPVNNCASQDVVSIGEDTIPPAAMLANVDSLLINCFRPTLELDATPSSTGSGHPFSYGWRTLGVGTVLDGQQGGTASVSDPGSYQLIVTDLINTCVDTLPIRVNSDFSAPSVQLNDPPVLTCDTLTSTLVVTPVSPIVPYTYRWLNGANDTLSFDSTLVTSEAGLFRLIVKDTINGCSRETTREVTANQVYPEVVLNNPSALGCDITASFVVATGSSEGPGYMTSWNSMTGVFTPTDNPYRIRATESTYYTFTILDTRNGCQTSDSTLVGQLAESITGLEFDVLDPACDTDLTGGVMVLGVEGGTPPYRYRLDGGLLTDRLVYENLPLGTHELTVVDSSGCDRTASFSIAGGTPVFVSLGPDTVILLGDSLALDFTTNLVNWDTLIWQSQGPIPAGGGNPLIIQPNAEYVYQLTVRDTNGCVGTDYIRVGVLNEIRLFVPNVFSPNGDNNNDLFFPFAGSQVRRIRLFQIFDRWGNMVHQASDFAPNDPVGGWDGNFQGSALNTNTFVWQIEMELADGTILYRYGDVVLKR